MRRTIPPILVLLVFLSACSSAATDATPPDETPVPVLPTETLVPVPPTETPSPAPPAETETPASRTKPLMISFTPNPVDPVKSTEGYWIWEFTFDVYNPNDFPVRVVAFGDFDECLDDIEDCDYSGEDFQDWFNDCGEGSDLVPAEGHACDKEWWVRSMFGASSDRSGQYAVYYEDDAGHIQVPLSETLVLKKT